MPPLPLDAANETAISHPARGVSCAQRDGRWHVAWRPLHKTDGFECRIEHSAAGAEDFLTFHEPTRPWSPFNHELTARLNRGDEVLGAAFGRAVTLGSDGSVPREPISTEERNRLLIEAIGVSEEIVSQLPADLPGPPPGSRTAMEAQAQWQTQHSRLQPNKKGPSGRRWCPPVFRGGHPRRRLH